MSILGYKQAPGSKIWKIIPELRLDQILKATQPAMNGQNDGARNYPPAGMVEFAETEQRIVYKVEKYLKDVDDMANKEFTDISRRIEDFSLVGINDDFNGLKSGAGKEFHRYAIKAIPELVRLRLREREALRNLNLFREKNHLDRSASYPASRIKHLAWLGPILVLECLANTYFFAEGSDLGYLGGFFQAFLVSSGNVVCSLLFARLGFVQLNHINPFRKMLGILSVIGWILFLGTYHLAVAHYRDLLMTDPDRALFQVLTVMRDTPFTLHTLGSMVVLVIGLLIGTGAAIKGYSADDPYPGYGKVDRRHKEREHAYEAREGVLRDMLVACIANAEEQIGTRLREYGQRQEHLVDLYKGAASVVAHFDNIYRQVEKIIKSAITTYREANMRVRTEEVPPSFAAMPEIERFLLKERYVKILAELEEVVRQSTRVMEGLREKAEAIREYLAEETAAMHEKIDRIADEVDKKAADKLGKEVRT